MEKDDWHSQVELDAWTNELERLSNKNYKTTDAAIFKAYKETLAEIKDILKNYVDNYEKLSFSKRLEAERLFKAAAEIDQLLDTTFKKVGQASVSYKTAEATLGYNGAYYSMEGRNNLQFTSFGIDKDFIEATVKAPVAGKRLSKRLYYNRLRLAKVTTNAIIRLTAQGKGYAHIARRITDLTEASYKQSMRIARTEAGRVRTIATQKAYDDAAELGVTDLKKMWAAGLDSRTRDSHRLLDGQKVPHDENFKTVDGVEGPGPRNMGAAEEDINCRCTTIPIVDDVDPELRRAGDKFIEHKTYTEWEKSAKKRMKPGAVVHYPGKKSDKIEVL